MFNFDVESVAATARTQPAFKRRSRNWTGDIVLALGDEAYRLQMRDGEVETFDRDKIGCAADLVISGPPDAWGELLASVPPPGWQTPLFASLEARFTFGGENAGETIYYYYPALLEFFDVLRCAHSGGPPDHPVQDVKRRFDTAVGRYVYVTIAGVQYRIYFEEAGSGKVPLILQHTASADGRQWRHLLENPDFQRMFRMISFDLPYHGKSLPPTSLAWWKQDYVLTREWLIEAVVAICASLDLERPVFMGCSVGGMLAPDLAIACPEKFRAVVGINSGLSYDQAGYEFLSGVSHRLMAGPQSSNTWSGAANYGLTAPTSPEVYRRETEWIYSQAAPGILLGDSFYFAVDHKITPEQAGSIDTKAIPVYLLTCEYDPLNCENGAIKLAQAIDGAYHDVLPGLGHFGPAENPEVFISQVLPLFEKIARLA